MVLTIMRRPNMLDMYHNSFQHFFTNTPRTVWCALSQRAAEQYLKNKELYSFRMFECNKYTRHMVSVHTIVKVHISMIMIAIEIEPWTNGLTSVTPISSCTGNHGKLK